MGMKTASALIRHRRKRWRRVLDSRFAKFEPEIWDEDRTQAKDVLYLDGRSFGVKPLFELDPAGPGDCGVHYVVSPNGRFAYQNRVLPKQRPLGLLEPEDGMVLFSGHVAIPTLLGLDRDANGNRFAADVSERNRVRRAHVWMSMTPMEMLTQRSGVEAANGTVVVGGLGLGWLLRKVCEKETVHRVVVVELSQELLHWYGYDMCSRFDKVTDVICDDVYNQLDRHGDATYVLDIWPTYQGANDDPRLRRAKQQIGERLWAWGWKGKGE